MKTKHTYMDFVSDCCGVPPKGNGDCDTSDFGICPECGEHCEYVDYSDEDEMELTDDQKMAYYHEIEQIKLSLLNQKQ